MKVARVIIGLGFGDEGKGTMTDFFCRQGATLVVRYNGGSQAGHNVVTDDGRHHTFAQIGSGAFVPGVRTLLSRYMLWDPIALAHEVAVLSPKLGEHALDRHMIDRDAAVITPFHVAANQLKEWLRGDGRHGSCGKGVGELACDLLEYPDQVLRARDLCDYDFLRKRLTAIQDRKRSEMVDAGWGDHEMPASLGTVSHLLANPAEPAKVAEAYRRINASLHVISAEEGYQLLREENTVFEGAQGVCLDEDHGFHPYTTWSRIMPVHALSLLAEAGFNGEVETIGIARTYSTRHGAGPFVSEAPELYDINPNEHNQQDAWQGSFRVGHLDGVMLRYAARCLQNYAPLTSMAITHLDASVLNAGLLYCDQYLLPVDSNQELLGDCEHTSRGIATQNLRPHFPGDLAYQERLTNLLVAARPICPYEASDAATICEYVEDTTGAPAKYLSYGPCASHKKLR